LERKRGTSTRSGTAGSAAISPTIHPGQTSRLVTRSPIYYGWIILAAAMVGRVMTSPGQTYSVSIFIEHFISDLGLSRSLVSTLYTIGTLTASLALPYVGRQIDRRGPRVMVGIVAALLAVACVYMGLVQNAIMLGIGFVLIRLLGQGSLEMVSTNTVNRWWVRRRGTVLGIAGVSFALLGSGLFPSLIHTLIRNFGWRTSYMLLGLLVASVMLPVGLVFFRRQPEDFGLLPDGAQIEPGATPTAPVVVEEHWTSAEAVRTRAFWVISLGLASIAMLSTGLIFHAVSIFQDGGLSAEVAAVAFVPLSLTSALVTLGSGVLVDRVPVRHLLCGALFFQAISLLVAPHLQAGPMVLMYGILVGITLGLQATVSSTVWAMYFGRQHLGSITGIASLVMIAGSALGPMPMGIARDLLGSYTLTLSVAAALPMILGILALTIRRPQRQKDAETA